MVVQFPGPSAVPDSDESPNTIHTANIILGFSPVTTCLSTPSGMVQQPIITGSTSGTLGQTTGSAAGTPHSSTSGTPAIGKLRYTSHQQAQVHQLSASSGTPAIGNFRNTSHRQVQVHQPSASSGTPAIGKFRNTNYRQVQEHQPSAS